MALFPQGSSVTASVDDPASHGAIGDSRLSLNEAIGLANGTLSRAQLSPGEAARVSGTGAVDHILVDAAVVPQIQLSAPLDRINGQGLPVRIEGVKLAASWPVLQAGSVAHAFELGTPMVDLGGFEIRGGQVGISGTDFGGTMMMSAVVHDVHLDAQVVSALRFEVTGATSGNQIGVMLMRARITNGPLGLRLIDNGNQGGLVCVSEFVEFDGMARGIDVSSNGMGGTSMCWLWRSSMQNGQQLLRVRRNASSTQRQMLRVVHGSFVVSGDVTDVQGSVAGETVFHHHHATFESRGAGKAYWVHPRTAQFDVHGSEMEFVGDVEIAANRFTQRIWHHNSRFVGGTIVLDNEGSQAELEWNRYENCTFESPATARTAVLLDTCELHNTNVVGNSLFAPVTLDNCFRNGGTNTGQVSEVAPAPSAWFGTTSVVPEEPQLGSSVTLSVDLPPGMGAVWDLAPSFARPTTTAYPFRFYGDPLAIDVQPGVYTLQQSLTLQVPNAVGLVGLEFYFQALSLPTQGQSHTPVVHLPRGGLVRPIF